MGRMKETLFDLPLPPIGRDEFDGETYSKHRDYARLQGQLQRVFELMKDGKHRTLAEIAEQVSGSEAGVSARLRDLRKPKFGGHVVERKRLGGGLWSYALKVAA